jgi:molybdopterin/thiamine biosynthesis adenylyltransferase
MGAYDSFGNREELLTQEFRLDKTPSPFVLNIVGDADYLRTPQGQHVFLAAINIACRLRGDLEAINIVIPETIPLLAMAPLPERARSLNDTAASLASVLAIDHYKLNVCQENLDKGHTLYIGNAPRNTLNIWADDWNIGFRIELRHAPSENPFSALGAACVGVAEVFKEAFPFKMALKMWSGVFSLLTYQLVDEMPPHISLPQDIELDSWLFAGFGAVGQAAFYALDSIRINADMVCIADAEDIDVTNLNRYLLSYPKDIDKDHNKKKVDIGKDILRCHPKYIPHHYGTEEYQAEQSSVFDQMICAVDTYKGRFAIQFQDLPRLIITAATGGFKARVSRHSPMNKLACLLCLQKPERHVNRCGQIDQAVLVDAFENSKPEGSVAFVSGFAGALLATELIKQVVPDLHHYRVNWFLTNLLNLPLTPPTPQWPDPNCQLHKLGIEKIHAKKWAKTKVS